MLVSPWQEQFMHGLICEFLHSTLTDLCRVLLDDVLVGMTSPFQVNERRLMASLSAVDAHVARHDEGEGSK